MERRKYRKILLNTALPILVLVSILVPILASAETDFSYTVLAPLPCIGSDQDCKKLTEKTELKDYLPGMFKLAIGLAAVATVLMIVIGGFQYMSSDAIQGKSAGKERIKNAIYSLVLIIGAWLILNEINPNLLKLNLNLEKVTPTAPVGGSTLGPTTSSRSVSNQISQTCPNCSLVRDDLTYSMSQSYINGLSCTTCAPISGNIPLGGNTNTNILPNTNSKLDQLANNLPSNIAWYVSEAYPPIVEHANGCHQRGTCMDISLGTTAATSQNINNFLNAANSSGLRAIYEVKTDAEKQSLVNGGVPASSVTVVPTINRKHFSVYNCGVDSQSCTNLPKP